MSEEKMDRYCGIEHCNNLEHKKGLCKRHYQEFKENYEEKED